jgi:Ca2+-binding EF-hand superfamily protein
LISTSEELGDYTKMFEGLDKGHDGFISVEDLT